MPIGYRFLASVFLLIFALNTLNSLKMDAFYSPKQYLQQCQELLTNNDINKPLHFIVGNEAADADSIVSSLCYAYHRSCVCSDSHYIPLVGVEKSKFYLRRDVELLLNHIGVAITEDLQSLYDIDWKMLRTNNILCRFTLVDHNALASKAYNCIDYSNLDELIIEILDHHEDMNQYSHITPANRLIGYDSISRTPTVASTCTIISEKLVSESNKLNPYYEDIKFLLTGVIGLDTLNMDSSIKKGTPRDGAAYSYCSDYLHAPPHRCMDKNSLYNVLSQAKTDREFWRSLRVADAATLDYKVFPVSSDRNIGISAILLPLQEFLTYESMNELVGYMNSEGLVLYVIMTSYNSATSHGSSSETQGFTDKLNKQEKEVFILGNDRDVIQDLSQYLLGNSLLNTEISPLKSVLDSCLSENNIHFSVMRQRNTVPTRKQLAPILIGYYNQVSE